MDGRHVRSGLGRQKRESVPCPVGHWAPEAREAEPVLARLGEFHFDFGELLPVNSKKCDVAIRQRPFGKRRPPEQKLMTGAPFGHADGKPQRSCTISTHSVVGIAQAGALIPVVSRSGSTLTAALFLGV